MTDIEFNKTDMKIEDIADDTPGEEEDSLDITVIYILKTRVLEKHSQQMLTKLLHQSRMQN